MHLQSQSVVPQDDEGGEGAGQAPEVAAKDRLPDGAPLTDGADEKRRSHTPYHPVGPVEDGHCLGEGGGSQGIGPGGESDKILCQKPQRGDSGFNDKAAFSAEEKHIGQQQKEQIAATGGRTLDSLHTEIHGAGIDKAYHNQDNDRQGSGCGDTGYTADCHGKKRGSQRESGGKGNA